MVMIGVDAHKRTHTLVAVDEIGRKLAERTVQATSDGHLAALQWAGQWTAVSFAVEDCRHMTRRLEQDLLRAGLPVVRVHTRFMATARRAGRQPGKSDPIDALAAAHAALREPDLPVAMLDGPARQVKLLSDYRHDLVTERTKVINRLRWHLHELDPELTIPPRGLRSYRTMDAVAHRLNSFEGTVARIAGDLLDRCQELTRQVNQLERELRDLVQALAPSLLEVPGCGVLSAAALIGETATASRFRSKDAYARFTGTAPIPVWSGNTTKVRLNRGGNRILNNALHTIAVTQTRSNGPGKDYYDKLTARGKTRKEALRLLRRRLSDVVFRALLTDERARAQPAPAALQAAA
ncbi:IS110 family transposase [Amycolatopsis cihanbeyliensis]|uniref:Transposase n=1 Tax=Amycolatopsis cihanbeyliensis TaxID=1128664 RepID=A0A542DRJ2_AMYCI|nr:IS110 family transposase [Amycolatopsis cihanbeyliensis]TQJ05722.1 transposase [Amycolatopsis cihanbeyliensis]